MNIQGGTANALASVQGEVSASVFKQSLEFQEDIMMKVVDGGTQVADQARAAQGKGTNLNAIA